MEDEYDYYREPESQAYLDFKSKRMEEKEFEIWSEGYAANGERGTAIFHGKAKGTDFLDALKNSGIVHDLFHGYPTVWGCRFFDNETDARKSFG